jgi:hypothetical protein
VAFTPRFRHEADSRSNNRRLNRVAADRCCQACREAVSSGILTKRSTESCASVPSLAAHEGRKPRQCGQRTNVGWSQMATLHS